MFTFSIGTQGIVGLSNGGKMDQYVWEEFKDHPEILAEEFHRVLLKFSLTQDDAPGAGVVSVDEGKIQSGRQRFNQVFFRTSVLSAYDNTCCITGMADSRLLVAGHIKPMEKCASDAERMDVQNGICLDALHSSAFERGLITIDSQFKVLISSELKEHLTTSVYNDYFKRYENTVIRLPRRARPALEFLKYHNENVFVT